MNDIRSGVLELRFRIDPEDGAGTIVRTLSFRRAFSIIPEGLINDNPGVI